MSRRTSFILVIVLTSLTFNASCESSAHEKGPVTDVTDGHAIVNAMISNPGIGETLRKDGLTVGHMTRQLIQPGLTEYKVYTYTCAMCNPGSAKKGIVTITEDERPTYRDGPVQYSVSFSIESKAGNNPDT